MRFPAFEKHTPFSTSSASPSTSAAAQSQHLYNAALALLFNRCFTATMSICLLGLTASYIPVESKTDIGVLTPLRYYVACSVISTIGTFYGLSLSLPLLRNNYLQSNQLYGKILRKRWTLLSLDAILCVLWIAAAAVANGSSPHFHTKGLSLVGLAAVLAFFQLWAIGIVAFAKGFRHAKLNSYPTR